MKELKVHQRSEESQLRHPAWNPVKELKDQHPVAPSNPIGLWNPVKELKDDNHRNIFRRMNYYVESGEGIERIKSVRLRLALLDSVESGEGIESSALS